MAGKRPARLPVITLKPNATAIAKAVITGGVVPSAKLASVLTRIGESIIPANPPATAMTILSVKICRKPSKLF